MAQLTQEQQDTLHYVIRPFLERMSAIGSDTYASKILDIIATLQRDDPAPNEAAPFVTDFERRDSGPQGPNWYRKDAPK